MYGLSKVNHVSGSFNAEGKALLFGIWRLQEKLVLTKMALELDALLLIKEVTKP